MGAGRKTYTYTVDDVTSKGMHQHGWEGGGGGGNFRGLNKSDLAGVIFGCSHKTFKECVTQLIFGLPAPHFAYVQNIEPGMPLFLFNYSDRKLHGTFESATRGQMSINPYAWTADGAEKTQFPAQVRVCIRQNCEPLSESAFRSTIIGNYYSDKHFWFELNHAQTDTLMSLFHSRPSKRCSEIDFPISSENGAQLFKIVPSSSYEWQTAPARASLDYAEMSSEGINSGEWTVVSRKGKDISCRKGDSWEEICKSSRKTKENCKSIASSYSSLGQCSEDTITINSDEEKSATGELMKRKSSPILHDSGLESVVKGSMWNQPFTNMSKQDHELQVLEKLKRLAIHRQNSSNNPTSDPSTKDLSGNMNLHLKNDEEKLTDHKLLLDQDSLKAEREIIVSSLRSVNTTIADSLQKYLELHASSLAQMQQEITELRCCADKTRDEFQYVAGIKQLANKNALLEQRQMKMDIEIQTLKEQVKGLERLSERREIVISQDELPDISNHEQPENFEASIFLLGGYDGHSWLRTLDAYSPQTDTIRSFTPMPSVRSYAAATILDKSIYVFGGGNGSLWYDSVERYDQESNSWTTCPSMTRHRGSFAGASLDSKIFALGGGNGAEYFSDVEMYDPFLGRWLYYGTMLQKRFALAGAVLGGALYALGGFDGKQYLKSVERLDPREGQWVQLEEMNNKRGSLSVAVLNEKLYAVGGFDGSKHLSSVEVYDPCAGSWLTVDSIASPRGYGAAAVVEDSIYIMGGIAERGYVDSVECYHDGVGWEVLNSTAVGRRSFLAAVVL